MRIKSMKSSVAAVAFLLMAGASAPAMADSMTVTISASDGVFNDAQDGNLYFAGAIQYQDNEVSGPNAGKLFNVFCDDPNHNVGVPGTYDYAVEDETFAQNYLAPLETGGNHNIANEIAGLSAYGLANLGNASIDEAVQLAIWKLEGDTLSLSGSVLTRVTNLLNFGGGTTFWDSYWSTLAALGYSYGELFDGNGNCVNILCPQTQGQLYITGGAPPDLIPEPGTLGLLGVALFGLGGATWRRRKSAKRMEA